MNYFIFALSLFSITSIACTTMSSNGATLVNDRVNVWVSDASQCANANINGDELAELVAQAANKYWNTISSSRLRFVSAGFWNQDIARFTTGKLCTPGVDCDNTTVPVTNEVIVSCNNNAQNFSASTYAKTAVYIDNDHIISANILINNLAGSVFGNLTMRQKLWVIAHELGHAAGLGHSKSNANLMFYTLTPDRVALGEEDYWGMSFLYPTSQDGCGLIGSISTDKSDNFPWWLSFVVGIFSLIAIVIFQKVIFKRFKLIF